MRFIFKNLVCFCRCKKCVLRCDKCGLRCDKCGLRCDKCVLRCNKCCLRCELYNQDVKSVFLRGKYKYKS